MKRRLVLRIILIIMAVVVIASTVAYFWFKAQKPWLAFFIACSGGVLLANLIIIGIFVAKNFKDK
jgi:hypothetical protein